MRKNEREKPDRWTERDRERERESTGKLPRMETPEAAMKPSTRAARLARRHWSPRSRTC